MPRITALRDARRGRVAVELDGAPWRVVPADVVVRAGLAAGLELDRPRLRTLAVELRRARALDTAVRALRRRDHTARGLDARLERAGVGEGDRREALGTLARAGLVDDGRFALGRARLLAERGYGDAAIRWDLERHGAEPPAVERALASLEPETERARAVVAVRGRGPATARLLARRGFADDVVEGAVGAEG